jgi:transposase
MRAAARAPKAELAAPVMEIEIGQAHVWIWRDADTNMGDMAIGASRRCCTTPAGR